ncbi:unnamed protein product [Pleuronectes platessa]|uniref:Uncharacterized protein n=1 Tax=Pleuronectes platessa TaxID=8262 RepID=A0A9N7UCB3_PLEPL|nr:unnamed protein product [Pleuronectes platessa]
MAVPFAISPPISFSLMSPETSSTVGEHLLSCLPVSSPLLPRLYQIDECSRDCPLCQPPPLHTPSLDPSSAPSLPPARPGVVSVWQAPGPVRRPVGCDGQQLRVPLPAVWRPLGSRSGARSAKVTSLQLTPTSPSPPGAPPYLSPMEMRRGQGIWGEEHREAALHNLKGILMKQHSRAAYSHDNRPQTNSCI